MKKSLKGFISFAVAVFFAAAACAQSLPEPKKYKVGKTQVWAIADSTGERAPNIFIADAEVIKKYVPSGKMKTAVMTFVIKTTDNIILVDTGYGAGLMAGLEKIGVKPEEVSIVLITHMHGDHISGLIKNNEAAFPNAKVKIGKIEYDFWTSDDSAANFPQRKSNFDLAKQAAGIYADSIELFDFGSDAAPGI
ncbi:MAG: MBL fold metallo-hydrolase, partial [Endomicrobium sp.]|nr:MBL fold metallo-hydrolase [Endomicrobium sp.]